MLFAEKVRREVAEFRESHKVIAQYVRDKNRRPVGVMLAYEDGGFVRVGWSKCKVKADRFNKDMGFYVAMGRAKVDPYRNTEKPRLVKEQFGDFKKRVFDYFWVSRLNY